MYASVNTLRSGKRGGNKNDGVRKYGNGRQGSLLISRIGSMVEQSRSREAISFVFVQMYVQEHGRVMSGEERVALKRVGRNLKVAARMVQQFHWTGDTNLKGYVDTDWPRDRQNMKFTSGGVIMWSGHCVKACSTSQSALSSSSGETERDDKRGSSAQWRDRRGRRLWCQLDGSCEIRLQQCNRNSSQRWLGRTVPTYHGEILVDPVKYQEKGS